MTLAFTRERAYKRALFYYDLAMASTTSSIVALEAFLAKQGETASPFGLEDVRCVLSEP